MDISEKRPPKREVTQIIDARTADFYEVSTIPGAKNIPHDEAIERMDELDRDQAAIFICNGPQCTQSPSAIHNLLAAGYPAGKILYYRGGMHDWVTLSLPVIKGSDTNGCRVLGLTREREYDHENKKNV